MTSIIIAVGIASCFFGMFIAELLKGYLGFGNLFKKQKNNWVGFDLDGTLAVSENGKFDPKKNGEPVPEMVSLVRKYLDKGVEVKIFTARISTNGTFLSLYHAVVGIYHIQLWSEKYLGQKLEVTCIKDPKMNIFYDDRAVQVQKDTGIIIAENKSHSS
ncbi:MAG: hypothetical protein KBC22_00775 [Candidatus Pacebacteria bacterium]|nr:hypothetical protein [Candidatus Paceibacterota bacterium]